MTNKNYQITLSASAQNIATVLALATSGAASLFCKMRLQLVPGATGPFLTSSGTAAYSATGPGTFRTVSQEYFIEDQNNKNSIIPAQYNVSGANVGDVLNVELHQN